MLKWVSKVPNFNCQFVLKFYSKFTILFKVNLIHVSSQSKNAADDKLRQAMRRFADIHGPPAAIMLISGDINFSSDLCDLRHR